MLAAAVGTAPGTARTKKKCPGIVQVIKMGVISGLESQNGVVMEAAGGAEGDARRREVALMQIGIGGDSRRTEGPEREGERSGRRYEP